MKALMFSTLYLLFMVIIAALYGNTGDVVIMFALVVINFLVAVIVLELIKIREAINRKQ